MTKDSDQRFPVKDRLSEADGKVRRFIQILENLQTPSSDWR